MPSPFKKIAPKPRRQALHGLLASALLACAPAARSQGGSDTPAKILVGYPAGGSLDTLARFLADKLKDELKRPVIVDNKPGAGGRVVVDILKNAPADGSVMLLGPDALAVIFPFVTQKLTYDPKTDLQPVSTVVDFPFALSAGAMPPVKTLAGYTQWASANFGAPGAGGGHHFLGLMFSKAIGVNLQNIPYQGGAPMMSNLIGGQVSLGFEVLGGQLEYHRGGKVRMLAVSSATRVPQAPDVPTFAELGYPNLTVSGFHAVFAPPKTPAPVVATWNQALARVVARPDVREKLLAWGYLPKTGTPEELTQRITEDAARWSPVIKASGFSID
jgi:tripartite-type tricarboxylate transporter receptor subunit TctC